MTVPQTPSELTPEIEIILDRINSGIEPEVVPVKPESYCQMENCYVNVEEKVKRDGGKVHYGWAIFQAGFIYEAIRHAVWEDHNEDLIDVTPWQFDLKEIMFAPDNDFVYEGQLVDSIRVNATKNQVVDDFIAVCETLEKFYTFGTRIDDNRMTVPEPAKTLIGQYENLKAAYLMFLESGGTQKSRCFCESGKQYNNCHGKDLKKNLDSDLKRAQRGLT